MFSPLFIHIKLEEKTYKTLVLYLFKPLYVRRNTFFKVFCKMSYLENSFKRTVKTREFADEGYLAEVLKYKKKHSGYVGQLTKAINKIEKCFSKNDLSKLKKYDNSLDDIIGKIRYVTTELNKLVVEDRIASEEVLNFCTEQEVKSHKYKKIYICYFITRNDSVTASRII